MRITKEQEARILALDPTFFSLEAEKKVLEKEARKRYKTGDFVQDLSSDKTEKSLNMERAVMQYYPSTNDMYFNGLLMYKNGKWAEIVPTAKYYKNSSYLFKVVNGYCINVCTYGDRIGIQRTQEDLPILLKADDATKEEFEESYKLISQLLKDLAND